MADGTLTIAPISSRFPNGLTGYRLRDAVSTAALHPRTAGRDRHDA